MRIGIYARICIQYSFFLAVLVTLYEHFKFDSVICCNEELNENSIIFKAVQDLSENVDLEVKSRPGPGWLRCRAFQHVCDGERAGNNISPVERQLF